jgi:hypothetical protein
MLKEKFIRKQNSIKSKFIIFTFLSLILLFSLSLNFSLGGCSLLLGDQTTQETGNKETLETSEQESSSQTIADTETATGEPEQTIESIPDLTNAKIGAEMKGAIPSYLCTNKENIIKIEIKNTSDFTWRIESPNVVRLGYHYFGQDVDYVDYDRTTRTVLPHEVQPEETVTVEVRIVDITNVGTYVIQIDPVLEGNDVSDNNFWFSSKGVTMLEGTAYFGECTN